MNSVQQYYVSDISTDGTISPFVLAFLAQGNLLQLQELLTLQLAAAVDNPNVEVVEWTAALTDAVLAFADRYRLATPTEDVINYANYTFASQLLDQNEARYYETAFWRRWCAQGIPDPNNVPLPLQPERTDFTVETSNYLLSDPLGYARYPTC